MYRNLETDETSIDVTPRGYSMVVATLPNGEREVWWAHNVVEALPYLYC